MKRFYSLLLLAFVAVAANAQKAYYLLPFSTDKAASEVNVYDYLPQEWYDEAKTMEASPERRAYEWFNLQDQYGYKGDGFMTMKDVNDGKLLNADGTPAVRVLWVNVDRVGLSLGDFDATYTDDFAAKLAAYVKAGGNLYLTKQATRLVTKMGRATWWPSNFANGGYASNATDTWFQVYNFGCDGNVDNHYAISLCENKNADLDATMARFPLTSMPEGQSTYYRTNNNSLWSDWAAYQTPEYPEGLGNDKVKLNVRRTVFEGHENCKIIGGWGHTRWIDAAGMIEFYPTGDWKGTVIVQGLAAYQWGPQNASEYNVKNLTKGTLDYLKGSAYWDSAEYPVDGYVGETHKYVASSAYQGYNITFSSSNTDVAAFQAEGNEPYWDIIDYKAAGTTTIKAKYVGNGVESCKTPIYLTTPINVQDNWKKVGQHDVTLDRSFTADTKATVCLPFAVSEERCAELGQFYEFAAADEKGLHFMPVTSTEANKPYLFIPSANLTSPVTFENVNVVENTAETVTCDDYTFQGTYSTKELTEAKANGYYAYTLAGEFATSLETITVNPTRCYLHYAGTGKARVAVILDGETTGIEELRNLGTQELRNSEAYNIAGQRVNNNVKGIFIQNGKKVVK